MALPSDDPLKDSLREHGIHIEPRPADPLQTMVASGVGGILGSLVANAIGAGWLGRAVMSLGGSVAGYLLATNRVHLGDESGRPIADGPESPMAWSDRR